MFVVCSSNQNGLLWDSPLRYTVASKALIVLFQSEQRPAVLLLLL